MLIILLLTIIGFLLIIFDLMFIPGGFLIAAGSGMILYAVYLNYDAYNAWTALIHLLVCLAVMPKLVTTSLNRVALKGEMRAEDGYVGVDDYSVHIGKQGVARSDLRPSGTIILDGESIPQMLDCIAEGGYIEKGERIEVFEVRGPSLVVRKLMS